MQKHGVSNLVVSIHDHACGVHSDEGGAVGRGGEERTPTATALGSLRKRQRPWYVALPTAARIQCREASFGG